MLVHRDLYCDAMLVSIQMGTNMATKSQQKHLSASFATQARIYLSRNSKNIQNNTFFPRRGIRMRLVDNCLVYGYQFVNSNSANFKTTSNLLNFYFHQFYLSFEKTIYLQIYSKITKNFTEQPKT